MCSSDLEALWAKVRKEWDTVFASNDRLKLKDKVDGQRLYSVMFALEPDATSADIKKVITDFIE